MECLLKRLEDTLHRLLGVVVGERLVVGAQRQRESDALIAGRDRRTGVHVKEFAALEILSAGGEDALRELGDRDVGAADDGHVARHGREARQRRVDRCRTALGEHLADIEKLGGQRLSCRKRMDLTEHAQQLAAGVHLRAAAGVVRRVAALGFKRHVRDAQTGEDALDRTLELEKIHAAAVAAEQAAIAESTEPDTVTRTVVRAQPLAVFFTIGQTNITDKEMVNLKYAAQVIKNSPGHVYKITGYADTQTGTPQRNEYLSNQRAQNVYDALVNKFGVSPKSLKIVPRKGQSVPFDNAVLDRVSIVE